MRRPCCISATRLRSNRTWPVGWPWSQRLPLRPATSPCWWTGTGPPSIRLDGFSDRMCSAPNSPDWSTRSRRDRTWSIRLRKRSKCPARRARVHVQCIAGLRPHRRRRSAARAARSRSDRRPPAYGDATSGWPRRGAAAKPRAPRRRARRVPGAAPARRHHERPPADARPRVVRRRRSVPNPLQRRERRASGDGNRRRGQGAVSRGQPQRDVPGLSRGHRRRAPRRCVRRGREVCAQSELAMAHFRAALELVEGEPLVNALSGYSWWEAEGHGGRVGSVLVDAACSLAELATDAGLFDLAWGSESARARGARTAKRSRGRPWLSQQRTETRTGYVTSGANASDGWTRSIRAARRPRAASPSTASWPAGSSSTPAIRLLVPLEVIRF